MKVHEAIKKNEIDLYILTSKIKTVYRVCDLDLFPNSEPLFPHL